MIQNYSENKEIKCEIIVDVELEGVEIPQKKIIVVFEKDKKPKVKGEGLTLMPKKGMLNQFSELLQTPLQAIKMDEDTTKIFYKLVSLDNTSDWVTADIKVDSVTFHIEEMLINTRKHGVIAALHFYDNGFYPSKSIITFNAKKFKIPLRFIGRQNQGVKMPEDDDQVKGEIMLQYTYFN